MKVTYLFGAGASAETIPVVEKMKDGLRVFYKSIIHQEVPSELIAGRQELADQLSWLSNATSAHLSIDTFAKKLYLRRELDSLKKLKLLTSLFFTYLQNLVPTDKRYDGFFASILRSSANELPDSINILSWNYDLQFELSYREFAMGNDLNSIQRILRVNAKNSIEYYPEENCFSITKLNGTSVIVSRKQQQFLISESRDKSLVVSELIKYYSEYSNGNYRPTLSFAWEQDPSPENIYTKAINASKESEVLVIIGYSFPYFNREIDALILNGMPKLKRVYFQSKEPQIVRDRFSTLKEHINKEDLVLWDDIGQFLLPKELSL
jgi:hypothetical protein